jgi:hypothetical protein
MNFPSETDPELLALEAGITRALESAPVFHVPADFAARVAAQAAHEGGVRVSTGFHPRFAKVSLKAQSYGRNAAILCVGVLLAMILVSAHRAASGSPLWVSAEAILCLQFAVLAVWLVTRDLRQYLPWSS